VGEVLQKALARQIEVLRQAGQEIQESNQSPHAAEEATRKPTKVKGARRRRPQTLSPQRAWQLSMYQQVHEQAATGKTQKEIANSLHIHPHTVRKYLRQETFLDRRHSPQPSPVEPYRAYLQSRWAQGCCVMKTLWQELQKQGFTGSYASVWHFLRTWPLPEAMQLGNHPPIHSQTAWLMISGGKRKPL
jgi:hypothetical protein